MGDTHTQALARIEERLESHSRWQKATDKTLHSLDVALRGNSTPGIRTRLDRIEQREAGRGKLLWITLTAAIAASGAWISSHWK